MKKFIAIVLMFAMCLSLFACKKDEGPSEGLKKAQEFVRSSYIGDSATTSVDIKLMGVTRVDNVEYQIEWSANSDKITFTRGEDKFVTLHVPTDNLEDIAYVLTATISDGDNSLTVDFERKVPARAGIPTTLADGTYVIVNGNLTFSSLDQSKNFDYANANEVTITDGVVSNHFKADVLTIKNVDGGITIQDAYGRYIYLKGTYNSFNVDATAPEEGHIWQVLASKDGKLFIINKMNGKTLAYDTAYSSWGAYPELSETRLSEVAIIAATAPEADPENPKDKPDDVTLADGMKVVIYAPGVGNCISSVANGFNLSGVAVTMTDGTLSGYGETEIWTVIANADGTFSFSNGGQNVGMQDEYASISMGAVNDDWQVIALGDGLYNLKNVVRNTYADWYSGKWSTYNSSSAATDPAFQFAFYVVE